MVLVFPILFSIGNGAEIRPPEKGRKFPVSPCGMHGGMQCPLVSRKANADRNQLGGWPYSDQKAN